MTAGGFNNCSVSVLALVVSLVVSTTGPSMFHPLGTSTESTGAFPDEETSMRADRMEVKGSLGGPRKLKPNSASMIRLKLG
jgi:hypothetical protein